MKQAIIYEQLIKPMQSRLLADWRYTTTIAKALGVDGYHLKKIRSATAASIAKLPWFVFLKLAVKTGYNLLDLRAVRLIEADPELEYRYFPLTPTPLHITLESRRQSLQMPPKYMMERLGWHQYKLWRVRQGHAPNVSLVDVIDISCILHMDGLNLKNIVAEGTNEQTHDLEENQSSE